MKSRLSGASGALRVLALFLMAGSYVNDLILFDGVSPISLAKILFVSGLSVLVLAGMPYRFVSRLDLTVLVYVFGLLLVSILSSGGFGSEYAPSIVISLLLGLFAHFSVAFLCWAELRKFLAYFVMMQSLRG